MVLRGEVRELLGDRMPSPDAPLNDSGMPMQTELAITSAVDAAAVQIPFFTQLPAKPVKQLRTNAQGQFRVRLRPGNYSVFVKLKEGWYANLIQDGLIHPVYLRADSSSYISIKVTARATF